MSTPGMGVLINELFGNRSAADLPTDRTIASVSIDKNEEALVFAFADGSRWLVWDDGQSCCESRYLHTDDDLATYAGAQLLSYAIEHVEKDGEYGEVHEIEFLRFQTTAGALVVETHNEHNGYYGGFSLTAKLIEAGAAR